MFRRSAGSAVFGMVVVTCAGSAPAQPSASFTGIGDLPGGLIFSEVASVSPDGSVVVGRSRSARYSLGEAMFWTTATGIVGLGDLPGGFEVSAALGVSAGGAVIVGTAYGAEFGTAVCWVKGQIQLIGDLGGDPPHGQAAAVSSDGMFIAGTAVSPLGTQAFRWSPENGMEGLGDLPGATFRSDAFAMSADGSVVVGSSRSANGQPTGMPEAMTWSLTGGMVGLGDLWGSVFRSVAYGVSGDGRTAVGQGYDPFGNPAVRWTRNGIQAINRVGAWQWTGAGLDASINGEVIVGWAERASFPENEAIVWTPCTGMRSVRSVLLTGGVDIGKWTLTEATSVSDDGGTIAGNGVNLDGQTEGWVATLPDFSPLDVNWDGEVDGLDAIDFAAAVRAGFGPDFNGDQREDSQDYFDFLIAFFSR